MIGLAGVQPEPEPDDVADALGDAILCAADPTALSAEGFVREARGRGDAAVRARLNGVEWSLDGPMALRVVGRLHCNRSPDVTRRQALRFARERLSDAMLEACRLTMAYRTRGVS